MANGDLTTDQVMELFENKSEKEWRAASYALLHNLSETCKHRCEECDKRYVHKSWFKVKITGVAGFCMGVGLGFDKLLKTLGI